jgi:acyl-CoA thioesterase
VTTPIANKPSAASLNPQQLAQACAASMWRDDHATQHFGMELDRIDAGQATMSMTVQNWMTNGHGTCHGGCIFTLADSAFAFACNSYNQNAVAQMASITFISPAFVGDRLSASAREISRKGRGGIYDITVTNQKGELIAEFRGHSRTIKGTHLPE